VDATGESPAWAGALVERIDEVLVGLVRDAGLPGNLAEAVEYETVVWRVAAYLSEQLGVPADRIGEAYMTESRIGLTPQARGVALPHLRLPGIRSSHLVLVRTREGVEIPIEDGAEHDVGGPVRALFFLVSPEDSARRHLHFLAALAERVDEESFLDDWLSAENEQELKEAVLHDERFLSIRVRGDGPSGRLAGREVREIALTDGALIALVHRGAEVVIPRGRTRLEAGDRLTIVGDLDAIRRLRERFEG